MLYLVESTTSYAFRVGNPFISYCFGGEIYSDGLHLRRTVSTESKFL